MGAGIMAAIPLVFKPYETYGSRTNKFSAGFFDCFDIKEKNGKKKYYIKEELLLTNYKDFLVEFYDLIEEDFHRSTQLVPDDVPCVNDLEEFAEVFAGKKRNNRVPFIYDDYHFFSTLGGECKKYWLFYNGSYKAYLEVYSTLLHLEKILAKVMDNPLASAIKFGIFG